MPAVEYAVRVWLYKIEIRLNGIPTKNGFAPARVSHAAFMTLEKSYCCIAKSSESLLIAQQVDL